jgi:hypothetical protein
MAAGDLSRYQNLTDDSNDVVPLFLGALKLLDDVAASMSEAGDPAATGESHPTDDAVMEVALGLLSLRRTIRRWAEHAAGDHAPASHRTGATSAPATSMLR